MLTQQSNCLAQHETAEQHEPAEQLHAAHKVVDRLLAAAVKTVRVWDEVESVAASGKLTNRLVMASDPAAAHIKGTLTFDHLWVRKACGMRAASGTGPVRCTKAWKTLAASMTS